jgi:hypothetical protein
LAAQWIDTDYVVLSVVELYALTSDESVSSRIWKYKRNQTIAIVILIFK